MIYEMENWGFWIDPDTGAVTQTTLPTPEDGDSFVMCNLSQFTETDIFAGVKNLSFMDCNLVNCNIPKTAEASQCNMAIIEYEVV